MGKALIVPGVSFAGAGLGKVTRFAPAPLESITIEGPATVVGTMALYTVLYTPSGTSQIGVVWDIVSGAEAASISQEGHLTVLPGATAAPVRIRATSAVNPEISATLDVVVTYSSALESIVVIGPTVISQGNIGHFLVNYNPVSSTERGVTWEIASGSQYATIDQTGTLTVLPGADGAEVTVRATSIYHENISATLTTVVTYVGELESISIVGPASAAGVSVDLSVEYNPSDTTQTGVEWEITSGSAYAEIDQTGRLTILQGASSATVTVRATSTANPSISDTHQIVVTYNPVYTVADANISGLLLNAQGRNGQLDTSSGVLVYGTSDFIDCEGKQSVKYRALFPAGGNWTGLCFYDSLKAYKGTINNPQNVDTENEYTISVPSGAVYLRFSTCYPIDGFDLSSLRVEIL